MQTQPLRLYLIASHVLTIAVLMLASTDYVFARDPGTVSFEDARAALGQGIAEEDAAELDDVSEELGAGFSVPTTVYEGGIYLDFGDGQLPFNVDAYLQDGTTRGIDLFYVPQDVAFSDLTVGEQQDVFNRIYGYIADNYAGDEGGTTSYYDESGGLYSYTDEEGVIWSLNWLAGLELTLSFDYPEFYEEHFANSLVRQLNRMDDSGPGVGAGS